MKQKFLIGILVIILLIAIGGLIFSKSSQKLTFQEYERNEKFDINKREFNDSFGIDREHLGDFFEKVEETNNDIGTAFTLFSENYICKNTKENPEIKTVDEVKRVYCGNYFFIEIFLSHTGPLLYGPFYGGKVNLLDCKNSSIKDMCFFVVAYKNEDYKICEAIKDNFWRDQCLRKVALITEDYSLCDDIHDDTLNYYCYMDYLDGHQVDDEFCFYMGKKNLTDKCLEKLARVYKDMIYCIKIQDENSRDSCFDMVITWDYKREEFKNLDKIEANCDNTDVFYNSSRKEKCEEFMKSIEQYELQDEEVNEQTGELQTYTGVLEFSSNFVLWHPSGPCDYYYLIDEESGESISFSWQDGDLANYLGKKIKVEGYNNNADSIAYNLSACTAPSVIVSKIEFLDSQIKNNEMGFIVGYLKFHDNPSNQIGCDYYYLENEGEGINFLKGELSDNKLKNLLDQKNILVAYRSASVKRQCPIEFIADEIYPYSEELLNSLSRLYNALIPPRSTLPSVDPSTMQK